MVLHLFSTGKSLSEALIFASTNQYVDRLLIKFQAQTWGEHVVYTTEIVSDIQNNFCT